MKRAPLAMAGLGIAALLAVGCGGSDSNDAAATATTMATTSTTDAAAIATTADANTASIAELTAALEAAGVPNAERWAREVEEYRPYPTDDPTFAKLKANLAKYNPGSDVLEKILSALSL